MSEKRSFLIAEWRKLVLVNYAVDPAVLLPYLPRHTELDLFNNICYVSLVGFMFLNTRLGGIAIPFHQNFEEVNLRFYVKHQSAVGLRRGVVFIKEIVPRHAITMVANLFYGEKYVTMPMSHKWAEDQERLEVSYRWKHKAWNTLKVTTGKSPLAVAEGSEEDFITNHFWGYTRISESVTSEYEVTHPIWSVYPVRNVDIDVDFNSVYGANFAFLQTANPVSVFLAEGSEITVKTGRRF